MREKLRYNLTSNHPGLIAVKTMLVRGRHLLGSAGCRLLPDVYDMFSLMQARVESFGVTGGPLRSGIGRPLRQELRPLLRPDDVERAGDICPYAGLHQRLAEAKNI
jgi:hypothetical protein